jgi:hypothetical protein
VLLVGATGGSEPGTSPRALVPPMAGVLQRDPIVTGAAAAMVSGAGESFVPAAAIEMAPQPTNAVGPSLGGRPPATTPGGAGRPPSVGTTVSAVATVRGSWRNDDRPR